MNSLSEHWNQTFASKKDSELGWFESDLSPTFELLKALDLRGAKTFLAGAGTTTLVEPLLEAGALLHLNDLSSMALEQLRQRLGAKSANCTFEVGDLGESISTESEVFDLWMDRAVLHFLTEQDQVDNYFVRLKNQVKKGGYVFLAEFTHGGALKCNALPVKHWNTAEYTEALGGGFKRVRDFEHTFINPKGDPRPYAYALFVKE